MCVCVCNPFDSAAERKTSRAALQLPSSFFSTAFLVLLFVFAVSGWATPSAVECPLASTHGHPLISMMDHSTLDWVPVLELDWSLVYWWLFC